MQKSVPFIIKLNKTCVTHTEIKLLYDFSSYLENARIDGVVILHKTVCQTRID